MTNLHLYPSDLPRINKGSLLNLNMEHETAAPGLILTWHSDRLLKSSGGERDWGPVCVILMGREEQVLLVLCMLSNK